MIAADTRPATMCCESSPAWGASRVRANDVLGRWGGEEFLLDHAGRDSRTWPWRRWNGCAPWYSASICRRRAPGLRVSLSAGLAVREKQVRSLDELIARADAALYVAKNEGRDLVRLADEKFLTTAGIRRATREPR